MSQTHDEIRALRVMVEELRAEKPPEPRWDAVEQSLLARIENEGAPQSRASRRSFKASPFARVLGLAAVAAALALGVGLNGAGELRRSTAPVARAVDAATIALAPGEAGARGERDLRSLAAGNVIEATTAPITFAREGLVAWTLQPGSAVRVRSMGDERTGIGHTVTLERGLIRAEVTPRDPSEGLVEAFAVEIQGTRVAVHGTAFSVMIENDRVIVDVEHGAVAVGPVGHVGATTGHLLVGPTRASFSLDGARTARMMTRERVLVASADPSPPAVAAEPAPSPAAEAPPASPEPPAVASPEPAAPVASPPSPIAAHPSPAQHPASKPPVEVEAPAVTAAPPPEPPVLTVATVRARLDRCFRSTHDLGSSTVEMSVSSTLRLQLNADGTVRSARFDPPLKPELVSCAGGAIAGRFAEGGGNLDIPVTFKP
ncbi:Dihydrolipoamide acyltransferase [Minicystis rosea]|nr:Dihydrolipoamide acyltransferase [Minicystis rosea]